MSCSSFSSTTTVGRDLTSRMPGPARRDTARPSGRRCTCRCGCRRTWPSSAASTACGAIAQLAALPGWVQAIAPASPVYWVIDAHRGVLTGEQGFGRAIAMLIGFGVLFTAVTLWMFRAEKAKESYLGE